MIVGFFTKQMLLSEQLSFQSIMFVFLEDKIS